MVGSKGRSMGESLDGSVCGSSNWLEGGSFRPGTHQWVHSYVDLPQVK